MLILEERALQARKSTGSFQARLDASAESWRARPANQPVPTRGRIGSRQRGAARYILVSMAIPTAPMQSTLSSRVEADCRPCSRQ